MGTARREARRAGENLYEAGQNVVEAGQAGMAAARQTVGRVANQAGRRAEAVAEAAVDRVDEAAETVRERAGDLAVEAGRTALGLGAQIVQLPERVREGARRGVEALEATGARAVVSMIDRGTKVLSAAAEYVGEIAPHRRLRHDLLKQVLIEQLRWAHLGSEAYDRTVAEADEAELRMRLVRFKLQMISQAERLTLLLQELGIRVPSEERASPRPTVPGRHTAHGPAAAREGLAHALTVAVQTAEGWRALDQIAIWAEADAVSAAITRASAAIGAEAEEQVVFLRQALLEQTVEAVFK